MASTIYLLCAATSLACALMLLRAWWQSKVRFLLWCGLCFTMLAVNNALLFTDRVVLPDTDGFFGLKFATWRGLSAMLGFAMLFWGLIWDADAPGVRRRHDGN